MRERLIIRLTPTIVNHTQSCYHQSYSELCRTCVALVSLVPGTRGVK